MNVNNLKLYRLGDIALVKDGAHQTPTYVESGIPFLRVSDINQKTINLDGVKRISEEEHRELTKRLIPEKGDILFSKNGTIGIPRLITWEWEFSFFVSLAIIKIKRKDLIIPEYLFQVLSSDQIRRQIYLRSKAGAVTNLHLEEIKEFEIPILPLSIQKKVVEITATWDKAIEGAENHITAKTKLNRSLMQQLLTGRKRFKEFEGQEWKEVQLGDVFREINDSNDGGDNHSVMTISSRLGLISQEDKFDRVIAGKSLNQYTQIKREDFAYNKGNSKSYQMGCIYQLEDRESALVPFVYICFRPTDAVCSTFYKYWFLAHGLDRQLKKIITSGARGDGLLNVNTDDFFKLKIPFPPKDQQIVIAQVFQALNKEINLLQQQLDALKKQKRGLMQKLLAGEIRVKVDEQSKLEGVAV